MNMERADLTVGPSIAKFYSVLLLRTQHSKLKTQN